MNRGVTYWTDGVEQRILYVAGTFLFALDAMAQVTKMENLFVLNRETGEPLFPVEERPVPKSEIPGEQSWPTQPFPAASFSFFFLLILILIFREVRMHLTKENDKEERERSWIVASLHDPDRCWPTRLPSP